MEETGEEPHRQSMYEVSKEIRESKTSVSRLLYVARLNTEDRSHKTDLNEETSRWIRECGSQVTGLMIVTGNFMIHLLESDTPTLFAFVKAVEKQLKQEPPLFTSLTLPVFTEENPKRVFRFWTYTTTQPDSTGEEDPEVFLPEDIAWGLYSMLLEIGVKLSERYTGDSNNPSALTTAIKAITSSKKLLPKQEILGLLLSDKFPNLAEFFEIFITPIDIVFDNEQIWPCPPELTF
jgi:hypothetical protein